MILIADGGSTKVDWRLINNGLDIKQIYTKGINPFFRTEEDISEEIGNNLLPEIEEYSIDKVYFFGAGCNSPQTNSIISNAITHNINNSHIEVGSDLLAAARGLCGRNQGIACIIGTGSNSCYYNGDTIVANVSPLGYILGDEGSGAVIGRLFVGACLKNQLRADIKDEFLNEYNLTPVSILDMVYKQPMPNRFLASLSPFVLKHIEEENIYNLVYGTFKDFFVRNVMQYESYKQSPVHFTGSVAYHYKDVLRKVATDIDIQIGDITQSPMKGLIQYYSE